MDIYNGQDASLRDASLQDANLQASSTQDVHAEGVASKLGGEERVTVEEVKISGELLVEKVKELIHQGNIRRLILKNEEGQTLIEIPLTLSVTGGVLIAALFPVIAAIGAIGAMVTHVTVLIERKDETPD